MMINASGNLIEKSWNSSYLQLMIQQLNKIKNYQKPLYNLNVGSLVGLGREADVPFIKSRRGVAVLQ